VKAKREFKLTEFEPPTRIRWTEVSKNLVSAPEGTYDLAPEVRKEIERLRDRNVADTRSHVPDQHRASMASLRQRNMLLLAENQRPARPGRRA
jgi:hypothetical protein